MQGLQTPPDLVLVGEEIHRLLDAHIEHLGDVLPLETDLQRLPVVALASAHLAGHVDVGQEVHLDLERAVALAGLAAPALDVEAEAARTVATDLGLLRHGEQLADVVEQAGVGGRVGAGRPADGRLVDVDDLVQQVDAFDAIVLAGPHRHPVHLVGQAAEDDVVHQRGLARAGDAGDAHQHAGGHLDVQVLEVVFPGAAHHELAAPLLAGWPAPGSPGRRSGTAPSPSAAPRGCPPARPSATTSPPCSPAPGPMSTMWSAERMVSSSCSTTITVLPRSRRRSRVSMSLRLSRWCRPMDGSSRM